LEINKKLNGNIADNAPEDMVNENKMGGKYTEADLFPADRLISKMGDNMAKAEAQINETPLWTEKTAELERKERKP